MTGDGSSIKQERALRRMCFGARGVASSTQCVPTSDAGPDTLVVRTSCRRNYADPNEVAAVIFGGGTGTRLFPLTSTRATPAVPIGGCYSLIDIPTSNCFNSGINKIFMMTQFNSASLNRHIHRTYLARGISFTDGSVEKHVDDNADITLSCAPVGESAIVRVEFEEAGGSQFDQAQDFQDPLAFNPDFTGQDDYAYYEDQGFDGQDSSEE